MSKADPSMEFGKLYKSFEEHPEPLKINVKGEIPGWLRGNFLRVGPAKYDFDYYTATHWFDGYAMLQNFVIKDGQVTFRSKFLQSEAFQKAMEYQRPVYSEFGSSGYCDPCKSLFARFFSNFIIPDLTDNDMVNVYLIQDEVYAATEGHFIHRIDPITLRTRERVDLSRLVSVNLATAHPHREPDGTIYNLGTSFTNIKYQIVKFPPKNPCSDINDEGQMIEGGSILCQIPFRWKMSHFSYYHSFGMSTNYIIFVEQPLCLNIVRLISAPAKNKCLKDCFDWLSKEKTRFYLIEKTTGEIVRVKYVSKGFFTFHHINAYEEDGHVVVDLVAYETADVMDKLYLEKLRLNEYNLDDPPRCLRFVLPLMNSVKKDEDKEDEEQDEDEEEEQEEDERATGVKKKTNLVTLPDTTSTAEKMEDNSIFLTPEVLGPTGLEMPRINYQQYNGKKYNYVYGTGLLERNEYKNALIKLNVQTKEFKVWRGHDTTLFGEPVFVPHPNAVEEDDGVILAIALELGPHSDGMIVLDAKTMKLLARADMPMELPPLLHGDYFNLRKEVS